MSTNYFPGTSLPETSLMVCLTVSTDGTFESFPALSENNLQVKPGCETGWTSTPFMNMEGEPRSPSLPASFSSILRISSAASRRSIRRASSILRRRASSEAQVIER